MAKRAQFQRLVWLALLLVLAFAGLGYRLVDLQVVQHPRLSVLAAKNTSTTFLLEPRRGDILDATGNPLAIATYDKVATICANPDLAGTNYLLIARTLAPILAESEAKLALKLMPRPVVTEDGKVLTNTPLQYVMLRKRVPIELWVKVHAAMTNLALGTPGRVQPLSETRYFQAVREKAVYRTREPLRVYPNGELAAHVLGFTNPEDRRVNDSSVTELVGYEGIEESFDEKLAGVRGWRVTGVGKSDGKRGEQVWMRQQNVEPRDGYNVVLTIDSVIQGAVEAALAEAMKTYAPSSACAVVIRPATGAILAMATRPTYDPAKPSSATRNRVITDRIEPGSTFKIVAASAALNEQLVKLTDIIDCEGGAFWYGGRRLRDDHPHTQLSVEGVITKSSNIGTAKLALMLGNDRLYNYIRQYGFGDKTGIPLLGEVAGGVKPPKEWSKITIVQFPMGHGLTVTPLQMAMAMAAVGNKGVLMRPMLVDRLEDRDGNIVAKYTPQRVRQVISEDAARQTVQALKTVVSKGGTAPKAALDHYTVAGKTGTALKVQNGVYVKKYYASFVGFFPADNPELCISVTLDEPHDNGYYGGLTAAPVFKQIAERSARYLGIRPDRDPDEPPANPLATADDTRPVKPPVVTQ